MLAVVVAMWSSGAVFIQSTLKRSPNRRSLLGHSPQERFQRRHRRVKVAYLRLCGGK
jgi:hypothetical protein